MGPFAFTLQSATATLEAFTARVEKHGPTPVSVSSLRISCARPADVLAFFSPTLKGEHFDEKGPRDLAEGLPLRHSHLVYPFKWDDTMTGAKFTLHTGIGDPLVLDDACEVKDFSLEPMDGGMVIVMFTVNCKPDAYKHVPLLYLFNGQEITVSVEPAKLPEMKAAAA